MTTRVNHRRAIPCTCGVCAAAPRIRRATSETHAAHAVAAIHPRVWSAWWCCCWSPRSSPSARVVTSSGTLTRRAQVAVTPQPALVTAAARASTPLADTAPVPTPDGLAADAGARSSPTRTSARSPAASPTRSPARSCGRRARDVPMQPASTNKVLTTAAALLTLDRDARLTTTVVAPDQTASPGLVVLKGGGDPTLSAAPKSVDTWYRDAARISDLADQVRSSGIVPTAVQVDVSAYSGPTLAPGWDPLDIDGGDIAPMESVMLDGGRTQPVSVDSARSTTPALDAGRALAVALGRRTRRPSPCARRRRRASRSPRCSRRR